MVCCIGETDKWGYDSGKVYFNKIKNLFSEYETLWCNLRDVGTDGCSAMRSKADYTGDNIHEDIGKSFITRINCDLFPRKSFAFHSVLRIISLDVQNKYKTSS